MLLLGLDDRQRRMIETLLLEAESRPQSRSSVTQEFMRSPRAPSGSE